MQDILCLGSEARLNIPGREEGQWKWQLESGSEYPEKADFLRRLAELYQRSNNLSPFDIP